MEGRARQHGPKWQVIVTLGSDTITLSGFTNVSKIGFDDFLFA
jgi:hypothetical protein